MIRALIADDERLMREQLRRRLSQAWPELLIVAEAENGQDAVRLANEHSPQIAFLDIRMPGQNGIEAAALLDDGIHVVFVTAFDAYAVAAFERGAIDYLLKPVDPERLAITVARLKNALGAAPAVREGVEWEGLLEKLKSTLQPAADYLEWIQASVGDRLELIPVSDILFFQSADKYTRVVRHTGEALIRKPIYELQDELDPKQFWQIHRSCLVNVRAVRDLIRDERGRPLLRLRGSDEQLEISRSYAHRFRQM